MQTQLLILVHPEMTIDMHYISQIETVTETLLLFIRKSRFFLKKCSAMNGTKFIYTVCGGPIKQPEDKICLPMVYYTIIFCQCLPRWGFFLSVYLTKVTFFYDLFAFNEIYVFSHFT